MLFLPPNSVKSTESHAATKQRRITELLAKDAFCGGHYYGLFCPGTRAEK